MCMRKCEGEGNKVQLKQYVEEQELSNKCQLICDYT